MKGGLLVPEDGVLYPPCAARFFTERAQERGTKLQFGVSVGHIGEGRVAAPGIRLPGAPFPIASVETGYYGIPLLKQPAWTWEIPLYFFVGDAAGVLVAPDAAPEQPRQRNVTMIPNRGGRVVVRAKRAA